MNSLNTIPFNPYIVGNPIINQEMFFGRDNEFNYIKEKFSNTENGLILTLAGERRSGKTSILFQILNGRLGFGFLPIFIDMQAMAGIENTFQFLARIASIIGKTTANNELVGASNSIDFEGFALIIEHLVKENGTSRIIIMVDEYEIIEKKIEEGIFDVDIISFCARLIDDFNILFLFTGSNNLENRQSSYWKAVLNKSYNKKIPYLTEDECNDLISTPLKQYIKFTVQQFKKIFRLSAGQPYYTQLICQRFVDLLIVEKRTEIMDGDIDEAVLNILESPLLPMIYFWREFNEYQIFCLSLLSQAITEIGPLMETEILWAFIEKKDLTKKINETQFAATLNELHTKEILIKREGKFCFRMDFFRLWIQQEQSLWKVVSEIGL
ncbi:MAG: ATP-binding protein [Bacteroidales bacterium]